MKCKPLTNRHCDGFTKVKTKGPARNKCCSNDINLKSFNLLEGEKQFVHRLLFLSPAFLNLRTCYAKIRY